MFRQCIRTTGTTESAGLENPGPSYRRGGVENARLENGGPVDTGGKRGTKKRGTNLHGWKTRDWKTRDHYTGGWKTLDQ